MSRSALGRTGLKLMALGMAVLGLPVVAAATATTASAAPLTHTQQYQPKLSVLPGAPSLAGHNAPNPTAQITHFKWILQENPTVDGHNTPYTAPATNDPGTLATSGLSPTNQDLCHPIIPSNYPNPYPYGNPNWPQGCNWPSLQTTHNAPIVTQGDQTDWANALAISGIGPTDVMGRVCGTPGASTTDCAGLPPASRQHLDLPVGSYIVSVMADGFEIGGARFQIPMPAGGDGTVHVKLNAGPLPLGTLKIQTFDDMAPTGGAYAPETEGGISGMTASLTDFFDVVTQDYYGYPLCTTYKLNGAGKVILNQYGRPTVDQLGGPDGQCISGADGMITIPNLAPGRYGVSVLSHDSSWVQTTTLEGAHDFDVWLQANDTGLDTEMVLAGEPVPFVQFGFVKVTSPNVHQVPAPPQPYQPDPHNPTLEVGGSFDCADPIAAPVTVAGVLYQPGECLPTTAPFLNSARAGEISGRIMAEEPYVPGIGGLAGQAAANGQAGLRVDRPLDHVFIALSDMNDGDRTKYVIENKLDGTFDIKGVPDGTYNFAIWDYNQDYAFDAFQVSVVNGDVVRLGDVPLLGWFTRVEGHVFVDKNANGIMDPGEVGVAELPMQILNRTNQSYEQGQNLAKTNDSGFYALKEAYPLGQFNVLQFFFTRYKTTGVTCQADNDPQQHTLITPAVDLSLLPIIGLNGRCDIGVQPYSTDPTASDNGGIVSTVTYQSYRTVLTNEQNVNNSFDVGIPDYTLDISQPVSCTPTTPVDECVNGLQLDPTHGNQFLKHPYSPAVLAANPGVNQYYASEHFDRPVSCTARMADGTVLDYNYQEALQPGGACVESSLFGTAFGFGTDNLPLYPNDPANLACKTGNIDGLGHLTGPYITPGGQYASRTDVTPGPNFGKVIVAPPFDPNACVLHGVQTVDGNYGFVTPGSGDYLVHVDMRSAAMVDLYGKPKYKVDTEANVNQYDGPMWVPQGGDYSNVVFGTSYNTGVAAPGKGLEENPNTAANAPHAQCAGPQYMVNNTNPGGADYVSNPSLTAALPGGTPFEGSLRNRCDTILVHVQNGQSVAPNFFFYTDVPLATVFYGYAVDDISVSTQLKSTGLGEVQPIPNLPVGLYDWTGRMIDEVDSDPNGQFEFITPSTNTFNCRTAAGPCPTVYRFVGNDPGQPAAPNLNYNPAYRTIAASFQAWPNDMMPADVAPWRVVTSFEGNGAQFNVAVVCATKSNAPQFFTIDRPYARSSDTGHHFTIKGLGFGANTGQAGITFTNLDNGSTLPAPAGLTWTDTGITFQPLASWFTSGRPGEYQVRIRTANGRDAISTLTFHVLGGSYTPTVREVGPGKTFDPNGFSTLLTHSAAFLVQEAVRDPGGDPLTNIAISGGGFPAGTTATLFPIPFANLTIGFASAPTAITGIRLVAIGSPGDGLVKGAIQRALEGAPNRALVVVYPNVDPITGLSAQAWTPLSAYFENIIVHRSVRLQGVGPGGSYKDGGGVVHITPGANIDGRFFNSNTADGPNAPAQAEPYAYDWSQLETSLTYSNNGIGVQGEVVYIVGNGNTYTSSFRPALDGFGVSGGDQKGFPGNISEVSGISTGGAPDETFFQTVQGGGITLLADDDYWRIGNNLIQWNSGTYGGGIRSGSPQVSTVEGTPSSGNTNLDIHHNRLFADGGTNLAGAIGLFAGSSNYHVHDNAICGNLSAEYGAGISHFGYSPNGEIDHNKIFLNQAIDEGGGIMVAGETPIDPNSSTPMPNVLSMGAGPVSIHDNNIAMNLAQDDGGGVRFLQAGNWQFDLFNNMITNNMSAHEGGGVAIDDATNVRFHDNTVAKNITTATAVTSTGRPDPAGVSTASNSAQLMACMVGAVGPTVRTGLNGTVTRVGSTSNNSTTSRRRVNAAPGTFKAGDVGSVLVGPSVPANDHITSVTASGNRATLETPLPFGLFPTNGSVVNVSPFAVYPCNGQPIAAAGSPVYSKPVVFNDVFWDNRAGTWDGVRSTVLGIGLPRNSTFGPDPINNWDLGVSDATDVGNPINPSHSLFTSNTSLTSPPGPTIALLANKFAADPNFVASYNTIVQINPWRIQPRFRPTSLVTADIPADPLGDYHVLNSASPVFQAGAANYSGVNAAVADIDGDARGTTLGGVRPATFDSGADQIRPNGGGGNVYSIHADSALVPLTGAATVLSDATVSPAVFNAGPANAAGNSLVLQVPGRALNTKTVTVNGKVQLVPTQAAPDGNLVIDQVKPSVGGLTVEPAQMPGGLKQSSTPKAVGTRGAPPSPPPGSSTATSFITSAPGIATMAAIALLGLLVPFRRRRLALLASTENGGHDVLS